MIHSVIGLFSFVAIFGGALLGIFGARALPEHHLSNETRTAVSVSAAIVGTLSALVLGLMISTASSSFSARSSEVTAISVDLIQMNRMMQRYGPEADDVRAKLRTYATAKMRELFPAVGEPSQTNEATVGMMETTQDAILALAPTDETHRWLRSQALDGLLQARWLLAEQAASSIPLPFLILLIFWLTVVFASFGLFAPRNATAIAVLCLCSMAVSGGITMILELDSPFSGLVRVCRADAPGAGPDHALIDLAERMTGVGRLRKCGGCTYPATSRTSKLSHNCARQRRVAQSQMRTKYPVPAPRPGRAYLAPSARYDVPRISL